MAENIATPSIDPADLGDMAGMARAILRKNNADMQVCMPATVVSYDRQSNRATVKPLMQMVTTEGESVGRASVASVPVLQVGGGGFMLSYPIKPGNLGWIIANDRDVSLYMQSYKEDKPNTQRLHSFEDGWFIPDVLTGFTIDSEDESDNVVIQSLDSKYRIAIWPDDKIKITSEKDVWIHCKKNVKIEQAETVLVDVSKTVTINAAQSATLKGVASVTVEGAAITLKGNVEITGTLKVDNVTTTAGLACNGGATMTGDMEMVGNMDVTGNAEFKTGYVKHDGIDIGKTHTNGGLSIP